MRHLIVWNCMSLFCIFIATWKAIMTCAICGISHIKNICAFFLVLNIVHEMPEDCQYGRNMQHVLTRRINVVVFEGSTCVSFNWNWMSGRCVEKRHVRKTFLVFVQRWKLPVKSWKIEPKDKPNEHDGCERSMLDAVTQFARGKCSELLHNANPNLSLKEILYDRNFKLITI